MRLVLVLRPAHRLMAPSTEPRTRMYKAPVHPNRELKLPNLVSHQTHAAYAPHLTLCITRTTCPTMVRLPLNTLIMRNPFPRVHIPHISVMPRATAHENGMDQLIVTCFLFPHPGSYQRSNSSLVHSSFHSFKPLETHSDVS